MSVTIKRIYEPAADTDGYRVLVDRLWTRGISKATAKIDVWLPDIGPSTALRKWFNHDPAKWETFRTRYRGELKEEVDLLAQLKRRAKQGRVTLVYSARDEQRNQAVVLQAFLKRPGSVP